MIYPINNSETLGYIVIGFFLIGLPLSFIAYELGYEVSGSLVLLFSVLGALLLIMLNNLIKKRKQSRYVPRVYQTPGKNGAVFRDLTLDEITKKWR